MKKNKNIHVIINVFLMASELLLGWNNCKDELLQHVMNKKVKCISITLKYNEIQYFCYSDMFKRKLNKYEKLVGNPLSYFEQREGKFILKIDYSEQDYINFLQSIDFNYPCYILGQQYVFGYIWYTHTSKITASERFISEEKEYWKYIQTPDILDECK